MRRAATVATAIVSLLSAAVLMFGLDAANERTPGNPLCPFQAADYSALIDLLRR